MKPQHRAEHTSDCATPRCCQLVARAAAHFSIRSALSGPVQSFVIDNVIHPLRCSKEDPAQISVYEALAYEHEDENEEAMGSTAVPSRLPLFAPFHAVAHPMAVEVLHKFHAPREIGISDDAELLPAASPKAKKQRKRKGAGEEAAAVGATAAADEAQETAAHAQKQRASTTQSSATPALAAAPSGKTSAEPLRTRVIHLLAAQQRGLSLMKIVSALSVAPASLAPVLDATARYVPPGVFTLSPALYSELRVDSWADYSPADRTRIVDRMRRMESEGVAGAAVSQEMIERYGSAASSTTEDAAAAAVISLPPPNFPAPPDHSQVPDEIPASMIDSLSQAEFGSETAAPAASSSSPAEPKLKLAPRVLSSYIDFLALRTQFLQQRSAHERLRSWIEQVESVEHRCSRRGLRPRAAAFSAEFVFSFLFSCADPCFNSNAMQPHPLPMLRLSPFGSGKSPSGSNNKLRFVMHLCRCRRRSCAPVWTLTHTLVCAHGSASDHLPTQVHRSPSDVDPLAPISHDLCESDRTDHEQSANRPPMSKSTTNE